MIQDEEILRQTEQAVLEGDDYFDEPPVRAVSAYWNQPTKHIIVTLNNGDTLFLEPAISRRLENATPEELAKVKISPSGLGLHWEDLDEDLSVPRLVEMLSGDD